MSGKKTQGMAEWGAKDPSHFDGSAGRHHSTHLESIFSSSPIFSKAEVTVPDDNDKYVVDDAGITTYYSEQVLAGVQNQNTDYAAVNDQKGIDMDYHGNIPVDGDKPKDMSNMEKPYRVPNPTNAEDEAHLHDPTNKGPTPDDYKNRKHKTQFGDGVGSIATIEESSKIQGGSSFTDLHLSHGPGTSVGG